MNYNSVENEIGEIENGLSVFNSFVDNKVSQYENIVSKDIELFNNSVQADVVKNEIACLSLITNLQLICEVQVAKFNISINPGVIGWIATLIQIGAKVVDVISWFWDTFQIDLLLDIHNVLYELWPHYRGQVDKLFAHVSEFSESLGWGVDGVLHLLNTGQRLTNMLGSFWGKGNNWGDAKWIDRTIGLGEEFQSNLDYYGSHPEAILSWMNNQFSDPEQNAISDWVENTTDRISGIARNVLERANEIQGLISDFQEMEQYLPEAVREFIPDSVWDGLEWAEQQIDDNILPKINLVNNQVTIINSTLEKQRLKAAEIANSLRRPGTVLLGVDDLPPALKSIEENYIDDVASRKFAKEIETQEKGDRGMWEGLSRVHDAMEGPITSPDYANLEPFTRSKITPQRDESRNTWFVGDY